MLDHCESYNLFSATGRSDMGRTDPDEHDGADELSVAAHHCLTCHTRICGPCASSHLHAAALHAQTPCTSPIRLPCCGISPGHMALDGDGPQCQGLVYHEQTAEYEVECLRFWLEREREAGRTWTWGRGAIKAFE